MNQKQNKIISAAVITLVTFLGFESLNVIIGLNQAHAFWVTAIDLFVFHVFWIAFVFDLHLKHTANVNITSASYRNLLRQALVDRFRHFLQWRFLRHFVNYFILPGLLFWAAVVLIYLNPFYAGFKEVISLCTTAAFALGYWHMKEHASSKMLAHQNFMHLVSVVKLYAAYIAFAAILGLSWYFGLDSHIVYYDIFAASFLLMHQALFSYRYFRPTLVLANLISALVIASVSIWVYHNWNFQYFTGALILLVLYNTIWGFIHHTLDKTFTTKLALEYLILGLLVVSIIFSTHNFGTRLI